MISSWINKALHILIILLFMLLVLIIGSFVFALYPYEPMRLDEFKLDKTNVVQGEMICFEFKGEKFYEVPVSVTVELVNGEAFHIMSYSTNTMVNEKFKTRCFIIPQNICHDRYRIRWTGIFEMNLLNHPKRVYYSDWIRILKKEK